MTDIAIYATAFALWAGAVGLALALCGATRCTCPVTFARYMVGERCPRHEETTEMTR